MPSTYAPRTFGSLRSQFPAYFQEMGLDYPDDTVFYLGVPDDGNPQTYPSVTILPNWAAKDGRVVMGQAFGHHQARQLGSPDIIEVYEYHSYGAMVIDRDGEPTVDLIIAEPMDKILVPADCHMTLLNLGSEPLVTYDVANPAFHKNDKSLQRQLGPLLTLWQEKETMKFRLNPAYINRRDKDAGVQLERAFTDDELTVSLPISEFFTEGRDRISHNYKHPSFSTNPWIPNPWKRFEQLNIHILSASPNPPLGGTMLNAPLSELLYRSDTPLHTALGLPPLQRSTPVSVAEYEEKKRQEEWESEQKRMDAYDARR